MNKIVPFAKLSKKTNKIPFLSNSSVVVDERGTPLGFVLSRDSFISFLEHIDDSFNEKIKDPKKAYNNPAGNLIDMIEEKLPLNPKFVKDLKSLLSVKKSDWIPFKEVIKSLHV